MYIPRMPSLKVENICENVIYRLQTANCTSFIEYYM